MRNILVQEELVNRTEGYNMGGGDPQESRFNKPGDLFRFCLKQWGKCVSKVYIDTRKGPKAIGWVFQKRVKYDDCNETFLQEAWITMHKAPPTRRIRYHYL